MKERASSLCTSTLASAWCQQELAVFLEKVGEGSDRIFVVQMSPVEQEPEALADLVKYRFWYLDDRRRPSTRWFPHIDPTDREYSFEQQRLARDLADKLRELMKENQAKEDMAGYCAIGLALMNDTRSIEDIREVVDGASRRFSLLQQAAIALGKLGDKGVADLLQKKLTDGEPNLAKLSAIASAIGFIGDKRTIKPLKDLLFDTKLGDLSRAFAAVALGGVSDKENLPWNSKISSNMNYRAAVETLTNQQSGILDIL